MERFHVIEDSAVIVRVGNVYANVRGGYVRLLRGSGTSVPSISWDGIETEGVEWTGVRSEPVYVGGAA